MVKHTQKPKAKELFECTKNIKNSWVYLTILWRYRLKG